MYIASGDFLTRNTERRVEVGVRIHDPALVKRLMGVLQMQLDDNVNAREMKPDGSYARVKPKEGERRIDSQMMMYNYFANNWQVTAPAAAARRRAPAAPKQGFLPRLELLKGRADVAVQGLPLGGQLHMAVVPKKQCAAQLPLQILDDPGDVGLAVSQRVRCLRKASGFGGIVENAIGFVADIHRFLHINLILRHKKYIFYISFHLDYNVPLVRSQSEIGGLSWNCG